MTEKTDFTELYNRVGRLIGWDFSNLKVEVDGEMPDFYTEVAKKCTNSTILLDIGIGSGERLARIAKTACLLIGIDTSFSMIQTAKEKHPISQYGNIRFLQMNSVQLSFPEKFFDIVSCRQAPFDVQQTSLALVENGWFFTQQVSEADKLNIKQAFGRGQGYREIDGTTMRKYTEELRLAGFTKIMVSEYNLTEYYKTPDDLLFLLRHTPIISNFGRDENDFKILAEFIDENKTPRGIKTNAKRYIIVASR